MSISQPRGTVVRFGTFELDLRADELRKAGLKIGLQQQPLQMLKILLQHPGGVVSREELRKQLWSVDIYVDFDRSLNRAMVKLREALGDLAESPRFIETLPKIGYRFIAPVHGSMDSMQLGQALPVTEPKRTAFPRKLMVASVALLAFVLLAIRFFRKNIPSSPRLLNTVELSRSRESKLATVVGDESRLYFAANFGGSVQPAQVSLSGGDVVPLPTSLTNVVILDISKDKSKLLVGTVLSTAQYDWPPPLWILPVLGAAPERIGNVRGQGATWMPNGRSILYSTGNALYTVEADGSNPRKFLSASGEIENPRWSPDGRRLRFDLNAGGNSVSIWETPGDGSNPRPLLPGWNHPANECCGHWTADGKYYFFQSRRAGRTDIWVMRDEPSFPRRVPNALPVRLTNGPLNMLSPFPSPDGTKVYAVGEQQFGELEQRTHRIGFASSVREILRDAVHVYRRMS